MITLGVASGPPVEKHNYTSMHVSAAEAYAEHGLYGALHGAVEVAASHYARALAVASVEPAIPALSPAVLSSIARRLIAGGESCHLIDGANRRSIWKCITSYRSTRAGRRSTWRTSRRCAGTAT